jgi:FeS assembly SUF system regulator
MLRIGKLTDYATVILATLATDRSRLLNAGTLSERTHIAAPTVAKLLKQMHRAGLVNSTRGTHGGYQLARDPQNISAAAILDALEGPIALTECSAGSGQCDIEHTCSVGRTWQRLSVAVRRALDDITLAQLAGLDDRAPAMPIERELRYMALPRRRHEQ